MDYNQIDKRVIKFFKKNTYLKEVIESGADVYSAFAAKLFSCDYNDCLEFNPESGEAMPIGQARRKAAKFILCSMYFSTKKRWHKCAFNMVMELPYLIKRVNELSSAAED